MEGEARGTEKRTASPGLGDVDPQDVAGGVCQGVSCVCELLSLLTPTIRGLRNRFRNAPGQDGCASRS